MDEDSERFRAAGRAGRCELILAVIARIPVEVLDQIDPSTGDCPLHCGAWNGHVDCVKLLLDYGADPNVINKDGYSPLHLAARRGNKDCLRLLLVAGANPNLASTQGGDVPLHEASEKGDLDSVKLLLSAGADVSKSSKFGTNAMYWATLNDREAVVALLLESGADRGDEFAPWVASKGWSEYLRKLLETGAVDVNAGNLDGQTAAYCAATNPIAGKENPCLDLLINEYHAEFLSKKNAKLTAREKCIRNVVFLGVTSFIVVATYSYLFVANHLSRECDTFYGDLHLQPYMYDLVGVFFLKWAELFIDLLAPALDLAVFSIDWHFCGGRRRSTPVLASSLRVIGTSASRPSSARARPSTNRNSLAEIGKFVMDTIPPPVPSESESERDYGVAVDNPMQRAGDVEMADRSSVVDRETAGGSLQAATNFPFPVCGASTTTITTSSPSLSSRFWYALLGSDLVKVWRKRAYLTAHKRYSEYFGRDIWRQTPYVFLLLQLLIALASLVVAVLSIETQGMLYWDMYQNFFAIVVNSGITTVCGSTIKMYLLDRRGEQFEHLPRWFKLLIWLPPVLLVAPTLTHVIPAVVLYCWLALPGLLGLSVGLPLWWDRVVSPFLLQRCRLRSVFVDYAVVLLLELCWRFLFIYLFHILYDWASILYLEEFPITPIEYFDVLVDERHIRMQSICFKNNALLSPAGFVLLFSWL